MILEMVMNVVYSALKAPRTRLKPMIVMDWKFYSVLCQEQGRMLGECETIGGIHYLIMEKTWSTDRAYLQYLVQTKTFEVFVFWG